MDSYSKLKAESHGDFMQPEFVQGKYIVDDIMYMDLDYLPESFYCRLSASGFLDCTDWIGPYDTMEEASKELLRIYYD